MAPSKKSDAVADSVAAASAAASAAPAKKSGSGHATYQTMIIDAITNPQQEEEEAHPASPLRPGHCKKPQEPLQKSLSHPP
ncbi:hypothetical protein CFO_g3279 [Ceratocystis platani]|uniref:Uncharacterized protein n=1 Tax=Ceratocystis fimbriata f. sp. platani TaxID=88771 RepID=A0A0F8B349_CERFI|nr:hypothetical protein CFO_g3279 [Ceratocystis platani]